jgi:hypothetical protein
MGNSLKRVQTFPEEARKLIGDEIQLISKLPVQGFKALLFAVATDLANVIVGSAEAMTIKARKIQDLLHEGTGAFCSEERKRIDADSCSDFRG